MVDLLEQRHREGVRFGVAETIERGPRLAVRFDWDGYKVFTFLDGQAVLLQDCVDRDDALAQLAAG